MTSDLYHKTKENARRDEPFSFGARKLHEIHENCSLGLMWGSRGLFMSPNRGVASIITFQFLITTAGEGL
jgi:hypothetical protein